MKNKDISNQFFNRNQQPFLKFSLSLTSLVVERVCPCECDTERRQNDYWKSCQRLNPFFLQRLSGGVTGWPFGQGVTALSWELRTSGSSYSWIFKRAKYAQLSAFWNTNNSFNAKGLVFKEKKKKQTQHPPTKNNNKTHKKNPKPKPTGPGEKNNNTRFSNVPFVKARHICLSS